MEVAYLARFCSLQEPFSQNHSSTHSPQPYNYLILKYPNNHLRYASIECPYTVVISTFLEGNLYLKLVALRYILCHPY